MCFRIFNVLFCVGRRHITGLLCAFLLVLGSVEIAVGQEENLNVFNQWINWNDGGSLLIKHLLKQASQYYDLRDREISQLVTKEDWLKRQEKVRETLMDIVGPFPEKTPLNSKITGVVQKDGYRVEKVIFESMPELYVIGCLFIPDDIAGKRPAILNVMGHYQESFRAKDPQVLILNLVKKGFIVLTIDPPGQGENVQCYDPEINFSSVGYSVIEHCYFGNQCFLSGVSPARYFIWDGIRAIDYLLTRTEVDPERIGLTGFSGGGTVTSYIGAFDDRVKVSVPSAWATAQRRELETKGAQDAETEFYHGLLKGITFEDLLEVRAPKPTLMVFTTRDQYISIQGTHEAYREVKRAYKAFGKEDNLHYSEDDSTHAFTKKNNEAIYAFFQRHLNLPGDSTEIEVEVLTPEELQVTPTGQISTYLHGRFIFDINKDETEKLMADIEKSRENSVKHLEQVKKKAKELSGYVTSNDTCNPFFQGRYRRDGYSVEMYAIEGDGDYVIPLLFFVPDDSVKSPAVIYLHPNGKIAEASPGGEIEKLVRKGYVVVAPDVLGIGESKNTATRDLADDYTAILIGKSIVGIQAGDISRVVNYAQSLTQVNPINICAVAVGDLCPALLHAAAFEPSINNVVLIEPFISYRSIVMKRNYKVGLIKNSDSINHPYEIDFRSCVAGALTAYDLPDLIGCVAPGKVVMIDIRDQKLESASQELIQEELAFPRSVYSLKKVPENLRILSSYEDISSIIGWCFK
ncbi:MAG: acetylxylan esterase [Candidatus Latescibacteria bacterium]|nr:acetylxylan esterase [Candidatus Latescibacterota bacterium]